MSKGGFHFLSHQGITLSQMCTAAAAANIINLAANYILIQLISVVVQVDHAPTFSLCISDEFCSVQ